MVYESETIQYSLPVDLYSKDSPILFGSAVLKRREDGETPFVKMVIRNVSEQLIEDMNYCWSLAHNTWKIGSISSCCRMTRRNGTSRFRRVRSIFQSNELVSFLKISHSGSGGATLSSLSCRKNSFRKKRKIWNSSA